MLDGKNKADEKKGPEMEFLLDGLIGFPSVNSNGAAVATFKVSYYERCPGPQLFDVSITRCWSGSPYQALQDSNAFLLFNILSCSVDLLALLDF